MKKIVAFFIGISLLCVGSLRADEGMWLLPLLEKFNIKDMKKGGCKLNADEIYSLNKSSLKDAVVRFANGCTAELISSEGLLLTNHHCGYGVIQSHSTVEHDYLQDGFWAMDRSEEIISKGLFVTFLDSIADVTDKILPELNKIANDSLRAEKQKQLIEAMVTAYPSTEFTRISVLPFYGGNSFYLFKYTTYKDVRLVGTPPSSIGKFGADSDNWMWPRHTGDFCLFRVYADKNGKPANPSENNVPYRPKNYFKVSLRGVEEGDFAMVMGYPGRTYRYMTSWEVEDMTKSNNIRIDIRGVKQDVWMKDMRADQKTRIQYSSKYASSSNFWKKSIGMNETFKKLGVVERRAEQELSFLEWVNQNPQRTASYGNALSDIREAVLGRQERQQALQYLSECLSSIEIIRMAGVAHRLLSDKKPENAKANKALLQASAERFYKDYSPGLDQKTAQALVPIYLKNVPEDYRPEFFRLVEESYSGNIGWYLSDMFASSVFGSEEKYKAFTDRPNIVLPEKDLALDTYLSIEELKSKLEKENEEFTRMYERGNRLYIAGLLEMNAGKPIYPDANGTMRLTYGKVKSYQPRDGIKYSYYTTLKGVMQKEDPQNWEFSVHPTLKKLYEENSYGPYAMKNGEMPVDFIFDGDITGGNSGSPVLNAKGELIGTAFDGNWEAMSGDVIFETELQRCINVDIRYVLLIIDKFAGAKHLVDEMTIVK